jgi:hypothetical protein
MDKEIEENKETLPDKVERYFLDNHKEKEHIKNILWKVFNEYNSSGIQVQLVNSLKKSVRRFRLLPKGWVEYLGPLDKNSQINIAS